MELQLTQNELTEALLNQDFNTAHNSAEVLSAFRKSVQDFVLLDNSMAVLSDFRENKSYIYSGQFGAFFGISQNEMVIDSAFEEVIFKNIHPADLKERDLLELRYFNFQKQHTPQDRKRYSTMCKLRAVNPEGNYVAIAHRTLYPHAYEDGSIWLALCIYAPATGQSSNGIDAKIIDAVTGCEVATEVLTAYDKLLLSPRETEVLTLISLGYQSKQIAQNLNISLNTVNRHRQNIISKLKVTNSANAVATATALRLLKT